MTQQELDALKALAEAATPADGLERDGYHVHYRAGSDELWPHATFVGGGSADAAYYMAMREAVPALIAEVERLREFAATQYQTGWNAACAMVEAAKQDAIAPPRQ